MYFSTSIDTPNGYLYNLWIGISVISMCEALIYILQILHILICGQLQISGFNARNRKEEETTTWERYHQTEEMEATYKRGNENGH